MSMIGSMIIEVSTRRRLAVAVFLFLGAAGCAGRMKVGELAHQFDPAQLQERPVAIGGVILGQGVELDGASLIAEGDQNQDPRIQADTWSAFLYRPFLVYDPDVAVWPWPTVWAQADRSPWRPSTRSLSAAASSNPTSSRPWPALCPRWAFWRWPASRKPT